MKQSKFILCLLYIFVISIRCDFQSDEHTVNSSSDKSIINDPVNQSNTNSLEGNPLINNSSNTPINQKSDVPVCICGHKMHYYDKTDSKVGQKGAVTYINGKMVVTNASEASSKNCNICRKQIDRRRGHWTCKNVSEKHPNGYDICINCYNQKKYIKSTKKNNFNNSVNNSELLNINIKFEHNKFSFSSKETKKEAKSKWKLEVLPYLEKNNLIGEKIFFLVNTTGGMSIYYNYACYDPTKKEIVIKVHAGANQNGWASEETHQESKNFEKNLESEGYKKVQLK